MFFTLIKWLIIKLNYIFFKFIGGQYGIFENLKGTLSKTRLGNTGVY